MAQKRGILTVFSLVCICLMCIPRHLSALQPKESIQDYLVRVWTIEDGLPQNSVLSLIQSQQGHIWFGTQSGLVRFDGVNPRIFNRWNTPQLKNDHILCLYEDGQGTLWIGTDGAGLVMLRDGHWTSFSTAEGLSNNHVRAIAQDKQGSLWLGTDYGLNRLKDGRFTIFTRSQGLLANAVYAVAKDRSGSLWIGGDGGGISLMKDGKIHTFKIDDGIFDVEIAAIYEDRSGRLWLGSDQGLYLFKQGKIEKYRPKNRDFSASIQVIGEDRDENLWLGSGGGGLSCVREGILYNLDTDKGFLDDYIYSLCEDHEGSLWVGTFTSGLVQLQAARVSVIAKENGLPGQVINAVLEDSSGSLWAASRDRGLCEIREGRVVRLLSKRDGLADNRIKSLWQDGDGSLWIGTASQGVQRLQEGKLSRYGEKEGLPTGFINVVYRDRGDTTWVGTPGGLYRFVNGTFIYCGAGSGLADSRRHINVLCESRSGALLVGTRRGLLTCTDGKLQPVIIGAPDRAFDQDVLALYEDRAGTTWIGTRGSGLYRLKEGRLTNYNSGMGLHNNFIVALLEDEQGNLWMSSYKGVFRAAKESLEQFADGKIKSIACIYFDERDGMRSSECTFAGQPAAWKTGDGKLCFATSKGIAIFDPAAIEINTLPPPVVIEEVFVDNESIAKEQQPLLPAGKGVFEFYFTALSFKAPERVRFRYKLEGWDRDWIAADTLSKRAALYVNLKPGTYRFKVRASNNHGIWNRAGASFTFRIKTPFFQTTLFYSILALVLAAFAGALFRLSRQRRGKKRTEKYKTSALDAETAERVLPRLLALVEQDQVYLDADLTLKKLAERLHIHYNYLSQIINEKLGLSFNDFINRYRIEAAKEKLLDAKEGQKTVLEIAYDTGFYSKSVFNTAFKKFTGMTPSQFKKSARPDFTG